MRIGSSIAKRIDAHIGLLSIAWPFFQFSRNTQALTFKIYFRVGIIKMQIGWNFSVLKAQNRFDNTRSGLCGVYVVILVPCRRRLDWYDVLHAQYNLLYPDQEGLSPW